MTFSVSLDMDAFAHGKRHWKGEIVAATVIEAARVAVELADVGDDEAVTRIEVSTLHVEKWL